MRNMLFCLYAHTIDTYSVRHTSTHPQSRTALASVLSSEKLVCTVTAGIKVKTIPPHAERVLVLLCGKKVRFPSPVVAQRRSRTKHLFFSAWTPGDSFASWGYYDLWTGFRFCLLIRPWPTGLSARAWATTLGCFDTELVEVLPLSLPSGVFRPQLRIKNLELITILYPIF